MIQPNNFDIAYSSLTDCYYVVIGKEKYDITNFVKGKIQQGRADALTRCAWSEFVEYIEPNDNNVYLGFRCLNNSQGCVGGICKKRCEEYKAEQIGE